ncbi:MAG: hypothetical protein Q9163_004295 [Psora crenata]
MGDMPTQLTALSCELKYAIFTSLPNVSSVEALALTSSSFYHTFNGARSLILGQVLEIGLEPELQHAAVAVSGSSQLQSLDQNTVAAFLKEFFKNPKMVCSRTWSLGQARRLSDLDNHVQFFTDEFISSALSRHSIGCTHDNVSVGGPPSIREIRRVKRALYYFEIYCNLFRQGGGRRKSPQDAENQQLMFFNRFEPWENEQLACIRDFLINSISEPFNDVAEHDIDWGVHSVPFLNDEDSPQNGYKEAVLSRGLEFLRELITAKTYEDRRRLLYGTGCDNMFLFKGLSSHVEGGNAPHLAGSDGDDDGGAWSVQAADSEDDDGPIIAWRWAHARSTVRRDYFRRDTCYLRERGYVMWDHKRLDQWRLLDKEPRSFMVMQDNFNPELRNRQRDSHRARARIWSQGGRGWWSPKDGSRVEWPT